MKNKWAVFAGLIFINVLIIYGRSLHYEFVYDDHWRVENNKAIRQLRNIPAFFTDTTTQASRSDLHYDNYRPLGTLSFALDYFIWGNARQGYRLENIVWHAINGFLVGLIGVHFLSLSIFAAGFSALIFLNHPVQVESVVWIAERLNVLGTTAILIGFAAWRRFHSSRKKTWLVSSYAAFISGLFIRETVVCFPVLLFLSDYFLPCVEKNAEPKKKLPYVHYVAMILLVALYLIVRTAMIGQVKIAGFWGGSFISNLANVLKTWPLYLTTLLWPFSLRMTYGNLSVANSALDPGAILGLILMVGAIILALSFRRRDRRISFCLLGFILFWLPGSNLVPMMIFFAERLLYPMIIFFGWTAGLLYDRIPNKTGRQILSAITLLFFSILTLKQIPVWQNDRTLWANATAIAPDSWFAWACRAQAELDIANRPGLWNEEGTEKDWLEKAAASYQNSLKDKVPVDAAGALFLNLASIRLRQGHALDAERLSARALTLNPNLKPAWERLMNSITSRNTIP